MRQKLKVSIFYGGFKFVVGGVNSHANTLKLGIQSMGHDASLITLDDLPILLKYLPHTAEKLINLLYFPLGYLYKGIITKLLFKTFFATRESDYLIFEDIYLSWNSKIPSVSIMHAVWSDNLQAFRATSQQLRNLKEKEITTIHNINHPIITVSEPYLEFLVNKHFNGALTKEILSVPLGIDQSNFTTHMPKSQYAIVYTGALEARKNTLFLLKVFKLLHMTNPLYKLTIIGDGPDRQKVEKFINQFQLPVTLMGRISHEKVIAELLKHELYIHTSTKESFSYALLEAKLAGLKTFAYSGLQVPAEFIDTKIDNFEIKNWFDAIIGDQGAPKQINKNQYTVNRMVDDTLEIGR
jgi:glycosyltransferase involved in cell wall biosynthesis